MVHQAVSRGFLSNKKHFFFFVLLWVVLSCFVGQTVWGADETEPADDPQRLWAVSAYFGVYTNRDFGSTISKWPSDMENDQLIALSLSRQIGRWTRHFTFEVEGLAAEHYGRSGNYRYNYEEFAAMVIMRYHTFPWNRFVKTSFAMGEGLSYTTQIPYREEQKNSDDKYNRFLNYLMAELTFTIPRFPALSMVYRIHHRSGIYGLIAWQGSNYYCLGVRYSF